jgi:acyl-CoA thioesterase
MPDNAHQHMDTQLLAEAVGAAMFARDHASQALGMALASIGPGHATVTMPVRSDMLNGHAICHGGLLFTLADSAFAFACNSYNASTVSIAGSIEYLAPGHLGDVLTATATEQSRVGSSGVFDVTVRNHEGIVLALFRGRSRRIPGEVIAVPPD